MMPLMGAILTSFLSTLSLRRATLSQSSAQSTPEISIHALLAESDIPIHATSRASPKFLSTLSLRRATKIPYQRKIDQKNFYPRSPCGERRRPKDLKSRRIVFLSTLSLRRATRGHDLGGRIRQPFLSTLSLRRATSQQPDGTTRTTYFYPRSPCGERRNARPETRRRDVISIHALLAESDHHRRVNLLGFQYFYPRSPCGERLSALDNILKLFAFLSTLSLRRATINGLRHKWASFYFYPRSPCGERRD